MGSNGILFRCYLYMRIVQVLAGTRPLRLHPAAILISFTIPGVGIILASSYLLVRRGIPPI